MLVGVAPDTTCWRLGTRFGVARLVGLCTLLRDSHGQRAWVRGHAPIARDELPMVRHPEAGHDLSLDAPGWVVDRVKDWASGQAFQSTSPSGRK